MKKIDLVFAAGFLGLCSLLGGFILPKARKIAEYSTQVESLGQKVEGRFDSNKNGILDQDEGINMARAFGYNKMLPSTPLMFEITTLEASNYRNKSVGLWMYSQRTRSWAGVPIFNEIFYFPVSRLEKLAKEN